MNTILRISNEDRLVAGASSRGISALISRKIEEARERLPLPPRGQTWKQSGAPHAVVEHLGGITMTVDFVLVPDPNQRTKKESIRHRWAAYKGRR